LIRVQEGLNVSDEFLSMPAAELVEHYGAKRVSPVELVT
jgi:hypothetical protein